MRLLAVFTTAKPFYPTGSGDQMYFGRGYVIDRLGVAARWCGMPYLMLAAGESNLETIGDL